MAPNWHPLSLTGPANYNVNGEVFNLDLNQGLFDQGTATIIPVLGCATFRWVGPPAPTNPAYFRIIANDNSTTQGTVFRDDFNQGELWVVTSYFAQFCHPSCLTCNGTTASDCIVDANTGSIFTLPQFMCAYNQYRDYSLSQCVNCPAGCARCPNGNPASC